MSPAGDRLAPGRRWLVAAAALQLLLTPYLALNGLVAAEMSGALSAALLAYALALGVASVLALRRVRWAALLCLGLDATLAVAGLAVAALAADVRWVGVAYAACGLVPAALLLAWRRARG